MKLFILMMLLITFGIFGEEFPFKFGAVTIGDNRSDVELFIKQNKAEVINSTTEKITFAHGHFAHEIFFKDDIAVITKVIFKVKNAKEEYETTSHTYYKRYGNPKFVTYRTSIWNKKDAYTLLIELLSGIMLLFLLQ